MPVDFSRLSRIYDSLGVLVFGKTLQQSQNCFLSEVPQVSTVLVVGGGTGRFLIELLRSQKCAVVDYVDISPGMIAESRLTLQRELPEAEERVRFICSSYEDSPRKKYDLLCTHCFLDCFTEEELPLVFSSLDSRIDEGGFWLFSDFQYKKGFGRSLQVFFISLLYLFFRLSCGIEARRLADVDVFFEKYGFCALSEKLSMKGLYRSVLFKRANRLES